MNGSIIIKLQNSINSQESRENVKINKLDSSISPLDFIKLLRKADNKVNPRSAKVNKITKSIHETLEMSPELFWYKSKGILLASENCEILERNRIRISLDNVEYEGIMDGGHNTFAIATFLVEKLFGKKLKDWKECKSFWDLNYDDIILEFEKNEAEISAFSIPVEIIYPKDEDGAVDQYYNYIAEICSARNNNVELNERSKGNQIGLYDQLKENLDEDFKIIWKNGESGIIKAEDVISMATIPLIFLQENNVLPSGINQLNPVSIYSQKSKCVDFYNEVVGHKDISNEEKGKHILQNSYVSSGLDLVKDIMIFFDNLYVEFPRLYNKVSPRFGGIKSVDEKKKLALFRTDESNYNYPLGFIYPLITGIRELIEIDYQNKEIKWKKKPTTINFDDLDMAQYIEAIKVVNYDPQTVGKQSLFYSQAKSIFESYVLKKLNQN